MTRDQNTLSLKTSSSANESLHALQLPGSGLNAFNSVIRKTWNEYFFYSSAFSMHAVCTRVMNGHTNTVFFVVVALSIPLEQTDVTFIYIYAECWMQRDNTAGMAWQDKCVWTRNGIHFFLLCISCCMHAFNALLGHFLSFLFFFFIRTPQRRKSELK